MGNKIALVVCLAACVSGDADADAYYGAYGYGLGYSGLAGYPYAGYGAYAAPYLGYSGYGGYGVTNGANTVGIAGAAPAAIPAAPGLYAGAGRYVANSAGVVHVAKRSADAEPEADAAYLYGGYGYGAFGGAYPYGLGYNGFAGYPYGYPAVGYYYNIDSELFVKDPLMLSQRPMPTTVTTDTELIPMLDMVTAPTDHTVWLTVMAEASTTKSLPKESRTRENSRFIQRLLS